MRRFVLAAVALVLLSVAAASVGAPAGGSGVAKKRCHTVVKKVHGKRTRVRVCRTVKPGAPAIRRIDVGGYKLAIECKGKGSPAVVLDSGFGTPRTAWVLVQPRVATTTRVCAYDRAGLGRSDKRPGGAATTSKIVDELHILLQRAGIAGPYVLGGWSIGGFDVRYYTKRYPAEVAGLVLVDATPAAYIRALFADRLESPRETMILGQAAAELDPPPSLGSLPLVDLTHGVPITQDDVPELPDPEGFWIQEQKRVVLSSTNSLLVRADNAGHDIAGQKPPLVAEAIKLVVGAVRAGSTLPSCGQTRLPQVGGTCLDPSGA